MQNAEWKDENMKILIAIDDTDNMEKGRGTGHLAQELSEMIQEKGYGTCERITRHQLLIHEDIPYTSHNSSMCFMAQVRQEDLPQIIRLAQDFLEREHAPESDPGLCVAAMEGIKSPERLIDFGWSAKKTVLNKDLAYSMAQETGIHLSEHGGTGLGIVGALAGVGLRLSGNDGEFKGQIKIGQENDIYQVSEICEIGGADLVMGLDGTVLHGEEKVLFGRFRKLLLAEGKSVMLVAPLEEKKEGVAWVTCNKKQLRAFGDERIV